jgi:hypothetical protein
MPLFPIMFRPTVTSSAQREDELAREICTAQANRRSPTQQERSAHMWRRFGIGFGRILTNGRTR